MTAAFFDLDGTLLPPPSAQWRWVGWLLRCGALSRSPFGQFVSELSALITSDASQAIERHRQARHKLVLVSGAPDIIVSRLGAQLGFDIARGDCRRRQKAEEGCRLADMLGVKLSDCFAYANEFDDRFLLSVVGHPFAVCPDRRLSKLARAKGWTIVDWTLENRIAEMRQSAKGVTADVVRI